jgi:hypothetical protein
MASYPRPDGLSPPLFVLDSSNISKLLMVIRQAPPLASEHYQKQKGAVLLSR